MKKFFSLAIRYLRIGIFLGIGMIGGIYIYTSAFSTLSTATTGQSLTSQMWNDIVDRVSNIFWNSGTNTLELNGPIKIGNGSTCNSTLTGVLRVSNNALQGCDGSGWVYIYSFLLGGSPSNPAYNCNQILQNNPSAPNGLYWIKPDANTPVQTWCDITGGGRTLVSLISSSNRLHTSTSSVGSLTSISQTDAWKLADSYINVITKSTGYKLECGTTYTYSASCIFNAASYNGTAACFPGGGASNSTCGVATRPSVSPVQIYGAPDGATNGCMNGSTRNNSGKLWVK